MTASPVNRPFWLLLRRGLKVLLGPIARWGRGFRVEGGERLPRRRQPLIVAVNHAAFIDSVYMIFALRPRFVVCGAKPRLFRNPRLRALMALANILRVDGRDQYLRDCNGLLAAGEVLLIYPEMGRFADGLGPFKTWAAEVALASGAPILPCYLAGTTRGQEGPPRLRIGHPLVALEGNVMALTQALREAILDLGGEVARATADPRTIIEDSVEDGVEGAS